MDQKAKLRELEIQTKTAALAQTEQDLANAVVIIQEREAELAKAKTPIASDTVPNFSLTDADADNNNTPAVATNANFGTRFPNNPQKGDMFIRVDMLPNRLFKWNGVKWIEIDKSTTDRYAHEEAYIQYLLDKLRSREYTMDDLSRAERDQVIQRMTYQEKSKI